MAKKQTQNTPAQDEQPAADATLAPEDAPIGTGIEVEPWEGERVCLIKRGDKDVVARRCTHSEYLAFGGMYAVEIHNEE